MLHIFKLSGETVVKTMNAFKLILASILLTGSAMADVIGSLDASGRFEIRADDQSEFVAFNTADYTWFSGDTIHARSGPAVLNLNGGGGIGFPEGSKVTVSRSAEGTLRIELDTGSVLYALTDADRDSLFTAGNFSLTTSPDRESRMNVSSGNGAVGSVELLEAGNIKVQVRAGELFVSNGEATRYRVSAGETVGLLDLPGRSIEVQQPSQSAQTLIEFESPEQVRTGEDFQIRWSSTQRGERDYIVIAPEDAEADEFDSVISTTEGEVLEFEAPSTPGDYEIRYIDGETGEVSEFVYLDVVTDPVAVVWRDDPIGPILGAGLAVTAGAIGIHIIDQSRNDTPDPVSP